MKSIFTLCLCILSWATMMAQTTLTFTPSKDNTIYEISNASSNGAGLSIFAGNDNFLGNAIGRKRRGLMYFDLSSIPANATITNVSLQLFVNRTFDPTLPQTVRTHKLHKVSADWGEGTSYGSGGGAPATTNDATWSDRFYGVSAWISLGGDFSATVSSSIEIGNIGSYSFPSTTQLIADVQAWVGSASTNYGWVIIGDESTKFTARGFDSRESATPANRPTLSVTFTPSLPIELIDFAANTEGSYNKLTWATASEFNNRAFEIERSANGINFTTIGTVKAANKASHYQYMDNQPLRISYYRLRQIDNDGTESFSKVVTVSYKSTKSRLKVYPTLVNNILNVVTEDVGTYQVINLLGQQVLGGAVTQHLDVSALTQGTYILRVGKEYMKFMKQ
jgi:hypothetical protein